ncbi:GAF domain-containing protein [Chondrinema litorale]|uniref:GAF domain-containing protein n=1 Tax=Chondrinema litorale TaxID=2994555 RepID=UPI0025431697|nr:GAF domain-containing protein [Chondrinema litorale]UZR93235.1 GAF domain-containing protein [Chondrinema litorale]
MFQNWKVLLTFFIAGLFINSGSILTDYIHTTNNIEYYSQNIYKELSTTEWIITYLFDCTHFLLCVFTANYLKRQNLKNIKNSIYLEDQLNIEVNTQLAYNISQNNLDSEYELKKNDLIGKALFNMRENLKNIHEENKINHWINNGISAITESLIDSNHIEELADNILNKIVNYIDALQACFYIIAETENITETAHLDLIGSFGCSADEKEKFKSFLVGESLVGEAAQQNKSIIIDNPPEDYVHINSGLGQAKPVCIIIIPLKFQNSLQGIIEISSFKKFKEYEIRFLETIAEKIAISLNSAKAKFKTNQLLKEAQQLNNQLKTQEEAMRLNMDIMSSTQSEIARINSEMEGTLAAINMSLVTVELETDGTIINVNTNFKKLTSYTFQDIRGTNFNHYFVDKTKSDFWSEILNDTIKTGVFLILDKQADEKWIKGIFTVINNQQGKPGKIFLMCYDVTDEKNNQIKLEETLTLYEEKEQQLNRMEAQMRNQIKYMNTKIEEESEQSTMLKQLLQQRNEQIKALESELLTFKKDA